MRLKCVAQKRLCLIKVPNILAPFSLSVDFSSRQPKLGVMDKTLVVYHLDGQTGRFTVWVINGSQSSGLVNFVPESRLPLNAS